MASQASRHSSEQDDRRLSGGWPEAIQRVRVNGMSEKQSRSASADPHYFSRKEFQAVGFDEIIHADRQPSIALDGCRARVCIENHSRNVD